MKSIISKNGFTLIELVVVIIILGVLAVIAAPKFIGLSTEAKTEAVNQIEASVKTANQLVYAKSQMPGLGVRPHSSRDDIIDVDIDGDGSFETRLLSGYLDNTDIENWIELDNVFVIEEQSVNYTYIGYDDNQDGKVRDDLCYFRYQQATANSAPLYLTEHSGC